VNGATHEPAYSVLGIHLAAAVCLALVKGGSFSRSLHHGRSRASLGALSKDCFGGWTLVYETQQGGG
jgi:hypothetical protein